MLASGPLAHVAKETETGTIWIMGTDSKITARRYFQAFRTHGQGEFAKVLPSWARCGPSSAPETRLFVCVCARFRHRMPNSVRPPCAFTKLYSGPSSSSCNFSARPAAIDHNPLASGSSANEERFRPCVRQPRPSSGECDQAVAEFDQAVSELDHFGSISDQANQLLGEVGSLMATTKHGASSTKYCGEVNHVRGEIGQLPANPTTLGRCRQIFWADTSKSWGELDQDWREFDRIRPSWARSAKLWRLRQVGPKH